jgi:hypothetical protein
MKRFDKRNRGYLNPTHPGKTREKLAALITETARKQWGAEYECWPEDLTRNNPCYVTVVNDGVSWDGYIRKNDDLYKGCHIHSWHPMGELLKGIILCEDGEILPKE